MTKIVIAGVYRGERELERASDTDAQGKPRTVRPLGARLLALHQCQRQLDGAVGKRAFR